LLHRKRQDLGVWIAATLVHYRTRQPLPLQAGGRIRTRSTRTHISQPASTYVLHAAAGSRPRHVSGGRLGGRAPVSKAAKKRSSGQARLEARRRRRRAARGRRTRAPNNSRRGALDGDRTTPSWAPGGSSRGGVRVGLDRRRCQLAIASSPARRGAEHAHSGSGARRRCAPRHGRSAASLPWKRRIERAERAGGGPCGAAVVGRARMLVPPGARPAWQRQRGRRQTAGRPCMARSDQASDSGLACCVLRAGSKRHQWLKPETPFRRDQLQFKSLPSPESKSKSKEQHA
jgi:hypothetical protein